MAGSRALRYIQLGGEATPGTAVAATTIWRGGGAIEEERDTQFPPEDVGIAGGADRSYVDFIGGTLAMDSTPVTFEQLPYILAAGVKSVTTGSADGAGSGKIYAYPLSTTSANTLKTYTIEGGDDQQEEEMEYSFVESFKLDGKAKEAWMMSATWRGRQITASTKTGSLGIPAVEEALFQKTSIYIDTAGGTLGTTLKSSTLIAASLSVTTGFQARWTADGNLYFALPVLGMPAAELDVTFLYDSTATAEKANWRSGTARQIRLNVIGSALTTAGTSYTNKTVNIDLAGRWISFDKLGEDNGNDIVTGKFRARYNSTAALFAAITVVNSNSTLT